MMVEASTIITGHRASRPKRPSHIKTKPTDGRAQPVQPSSHADQVVLSKASQANVVVSEQIPEPSLVGQVLAGKWRAAKEIGRGGMGIIYAAEDLATGQIVAIKVQNPSIEENWLAHEYEALLSAQGRPNVLQVIQYGESNSRPYLVSEYVQGIEASAFLNHKNGELSVPEALDVMRSVCVGLQPLHENGYAHRDVKPPNVIVSSTGRATLIDTGLAVRFSNTNDGLLVGTLSYMSPEQLAGGQLTPASDIFSVGVTGYQLMARGLPFNSTSDGFPIQNPESGVNYNLFPRALGSSNTSLFPRMLSLDPQARYQNVSEVVAAIDAYTAQEAQAHDSFHAATEARTQIVRAGQAPRAGTLVYFKGEKIGANFEGAAEKAFTKENGYMVYRSDRRGSEGIYIFSPLDSASTKSRTDVFLEEDARTYNGAKPTYVEIDAPTARLAEAFGVSAVDFIKLQADGLEPFINQLRAVVDAKKIEIWLIEHGKEFLGDPAKRVELARLVEDVHAIAAGKKALSLHGTGLLVGLAALFGVEKLADILGVTDPKLRLVFVLGISHSINYSSIRVFDDQIRQRTYEEFASLRIKYKATEGSGARSLFAGKIIGKAFGSFALTFVKGLGEMSVVSNLLRMAGVDNPIANTIGTFVIPAAARGAYAYAAARAGERTMEGLAASFAGKSARFAGASFAWASTLAFIGDSFVGLVDGDYKANVRERTIKELKKQGLYNPGISLTRIFMASTYTADVVERGIDVTAPQTYIDKIANEIAQQDLQSSFRIRRALAQSFEKITDEAAIADFFAEISWDKITTKLSAEMPISGKRISHVANQKDIFEFALNYMAENGIIDPDNSQVVAAVVDRFSLKSAGQYLTSDLKEKFTRFAIQRQVAELCFLNPESYHKGMPERSSMSFLNDDIRDMFESDGSIKKGQESAFIRWVAENSISK